MRTLTQDSGRLLQRPLLRTRNVGDFSSTSISTSSRHKSRDKIASSPALRTLDVVPFFWSHRSPKQHRNLLSLALTNDETLRANSKGIVECFASFNSALECEKFQKSREGCPMYANSVPLLIFNTPQPLISCFPLYIRTHIQPI